MDLFEAAQDQTSIRPLAERLRPRRWEDFHGQSEVRKVLGPYLKSPQSLPNLILWGPPGCGKTTLARLLAERSEAHYINLNAVETGSKEIRELGEQAHFRRISGQGRTLVFIDEIHRLNKGQQDVLLPFTESGDFVLIGATTENPSYELNSALLSRARVLILQRLTDEELREIYQHGCQELKADCTQLLSSEGENALMTWGTATPEKCLARSKRSSYIRKFIRAPTVPQILAKFCKSLRFATIKSQTSTTTRFQHLSKASAAATQTPRFITWRECWKAAKTPSSSRVG